MINRQRPPSPFSQAQKTRTIKAAFNALQQSKLTTLKDLLNKTYLASTNTTMAAITASAANYDPDTSIDAIAVESDNQEERPYLDATNIKELLLEAAKQQKFKIVYFFLTAQDTLKLHQHYTNLDLSIVVKPANRLPVVVDFILLKSYLKSIQNLESNAKPGFVDKITAMLFTASFDYYFAKKDFHAIAELIKQNNGKYFHNKKTWQQFIRDCKQKILIAGNFDCIEIVHKEFADSDFIAAFLRKQIEGLLENDHDHTWQYIQVLLEKADKFFGKVNSTKKQALIKHIKEQLIKNAHAATFFQSTKFLDYRNSAFVTAKLTYLQQTTNEVVDRQVKTDFFEGTKTKSKDVTRLHKQCLKLCQQMLEFLNLLVSKRCKHNGDLFVDDPHGAMLKSTLAKALAIYNRTESNSYDKCVDMLRLVLTAYREMQPNTVKTMNGDTARKEILAFIRGKTKSFESLSVDLSEIEDENLPKVQHETKRVFLMRATLDKKVLPTMQRRVKSSR